MITVYSFVSYISVTTYENVNFHSVCIHLPSHNFSFYVTNDHSEVCKSSLLVTMTVVLLPNNAW